MKRTACIILLIAILLQAGGLMIFYKIQSSFVSLEMHEMLEKKQDGFQELTLTTDELSRAWTAPDEISYKGKMFEVKSFSVSGNVATLRVISDTKEDHIKAKIQLTGKTKPHNGFLNQMIELLTMVYVQPQQYQFVVFHAQESKGYSIYYAYIIALSGKVLSPPPKLAC